MKITRFGRTSGSVSATREERLSVANPQDDKYTVETRLDITGFAGVDRGSMLEVSLTENELRGLLNKIEVKRAKAAIAVRQALEERCEKAEARLDLIWELLVSNGTLACPFGGDPLKHRDTVVLKLVMSLARSGADVSRARRMVKAKK